MIRKIEIENAVPINITPALVMKAVAIMQTMKSIGITPIEVLLVEQLEKEAEAEKKPPISDIQPSDLEKVKNQNESSCCSYCKSKKGNSEINLGGSDEVGEGLELAKVLLNALGKRIGEEMRAARHEL